MSVPPPAWYEGILTSAILVPPLFWGRIMSRMGLIRNVAGLG